MTDVLASWNDGPAKSAILEFVTAVTREGSPAFVPAAERIATFDNDGTLWLEKPAYIQVLHALRAIGQMAAANSELRDRQPFKAVYEKDQAWLDEVTADYATDSSAYRTLAAGFAAGLEGTTVDAFEADALNFLSTTRDARFDRPYTQLTYGPMVELVHYLQSADFDVYLSSGLGRDFMRAVCEDVYGIPRAMAIGSSVTFEYAEDAQGVAQVVRTREIEQPADDGPGKPVHIHRAIGRRPLMAVGNSSGDVYMLKYATGHPGATLGLLVHHDDAEREYAYDGGAEEALRLADTEGWVIVSMKDDWTTVFGDR
jgi:phosphoglycolate phosphatase-like HAD superfamily hydrolase